MKDFISPTERINDLERRLTALANEKLRSEYEDSTLHIVSKQAIWKGGEHLLLRCYKQMPIVLSEYMLPVELQRNESNQVEVMATSQASMYSAILLDCGNAVLLIDFKSADRRGLRISYFKDLFDWNDLEGKEMNPNMISSLPYISPIEYGKRWFVGSKGTCNSGLLKSSRELDLEKRRKQEELKIKKLFASQRELSKEMAALKSEIFEIKRMIKEISRLQTS